MTLSERFPICPICNEPVEIATSNTDEHGKAVHEDCYVQSLKEKSQASNAA